MRHVRGEVHVTAVLAAIDIRPCPAVISRSGTALEPVLFCVTRYAAAVGKSKRFLKRKIDPLSRTSQSTMPNPREGDGSSDARRNLIRQMTRRGALPFRVIALTIQEATRSIRDRIAPLVPAVRAGAAERRDRDGHERRFGRSQLIVVKSDLLEVFEWCRLDEKIGR